MSNRTKFRHSIAGLLASCLLISHGAGFTFILNNTNPPPNGTGLPIKWPAGPVPLRIMLGTDPTTQDTNFNLAAQAAANIWNGSLGSVQFQSTLVAKGSATQRNGVNELAFSNDVFGTAFGDNVLAVTTGFSLGNERTESDTLFNTAKQWDSYRGGIQQKFDLRRVALHELGHILGLDHPDEAKPTPQAVVAIMNSHIGALDTLADDDIQGAQSLYGPPGVPANNNFANATTIDAFSGTVTLTGYNTNSTKETGEPGHAGNVGGRSVWWRWKPASYGTATIDSRGSYFDTILAVYTGTSVSALTEVASNDDITSGVVQASSVTLNVIGGTTYSIAVDGFNNVVHDSTDTSGADNAGIKLNIAYTAVSGNPPTILTQPAGATVDVGGSVTFSVSASGSDPLSYQWLFNGVAINGATNSSLSIASVQASNGGTYAVTVSNNAGVATSNNVTLTVRSPAPPPPPPSPSSGGGGGGGGAPSLWFVGALAALGLGRLRRRHRP